MASHTNPSQLDVLLEILGVLSMTRVGTGSFYGTNT